MSTPILEPGEIRDAALAQVLGEKYLAYALSTILNRALPDVRDGLKPVHRRILYAMRELKLAAGGPHKKSARVVGDVIGKYHPHGDQAVYDAMVRLAQEFSSRYPLVDGQGNFGNVDGDNAAAMRYTEARLTAVAEAMLDGIDEDTVDFRPTYDGSEEEPEVLPAGFPNLLANGAQGIAVGMATSIPPHNAGEVCGALLHLIEHPDADENQIMLRLPGPDFPTGGVIVEPRESILEAYATGRGGFRVRARWEKEETGRGTYQIVVTEIPYQVQKSKLIEQIAGLIEAKKLPILADVRDESTEDVRIVLEPRARTVDPDLLMESLFKLSDLETRVSLNMNVLDGGRVPRVMTLKEVLRAFLDHRREVLIRRSSFRLGKIERRLEILEGFIVAYLNLDEVIRIIREEDEPKAELMAAFSLSDTQAEAILNMRLRSLRKLEEMEIRKEHEGLTAERAELLSLLDSERKQWKRIAEQVADIRKRFGEGSPNGARKTDFADPPAIVEVPMEAMIEKEPITVLLSEKGWIRAMKGHLTPDADVKYKDGDRERFRIHAQTTDKLLLFATSGRFYTIGCDKLPGGRGHGEPIRLIIDLPNDHDVVDLIPFAGGRKLLVASTEGRGFIVPEDEVVAQTRAGKQILSVDKGTEAKLCKPVTGAMIAVVGENRKLLVFPVSDLPEMVRGKGVRLQKYRDGGLSDATTFDPETGLQWQDSSGRTWTVQDLAEWTGARASAGRMPPKGFPRNNRFG
ncbi:MAG: DNA topoisomerase IV subunit A [Alphaproteobacteria bacterium]|nr:DNA topoisomerase IV subunit A [Alphaproteobacteria bacterium]